MYLCMYIYIHKECPYHHSIDSLLMFTIVMAASVTNKASPAQLQRLPAYTCITPRFSLYTTMAALCKRKAL